MRYLSLIALLVKPHKLTEEELAEEQEMADSQDFGMKMQ